MCMLSALARSTRLVTSTALAVSASYAAALCVTRDARLSEDVIDLAHSVIATACSASAVSDAGGLYGTPPPPAWAMVVAEEEGKQEGPWTSWLASKMSPSLQSALLPLRRALVPVLPPDADERARRFVLCSSSYFACDLGLILSSLLIGRQPHQWAGRLIHHVIQFVANAPAFSRDSTGAVVRRYLLTAYLAEASTVLLRIRGISRSTGGGAGTQKMLLRALLLSFVLSRLLNFPLNMHAIYQAKAALPPSVWRLHLAFAAAGIALSAAWFKQLSSGAIKSLHA